MATTITLADPRGGARRTVEVAATPEAEAAAVAFLKRVTKWAGTDYVVIFDIEDGEDIGEVLADFLYPTCEHGLSLDLCAGPGHYPPDDPTYF